MTWIRGLLFWFFILSFVAIGGLNLMTSFGHLFLPGESAQWLSAQTAAACQHPSALVEAFLCDEVWIFKSWNAKYLIIGFNLAFVLWAISMIWRGSMR